MVDSLETSQDYIRKHITGNFEKALEFERVEISEGEF